MIAGIPYGYANGVDAEWCIHDEARPDFMLCGQRKGFIPEAPPLFPRFVHDRCRVKWFRQGRVPADRGLTVYGVCPDCAGEVPLDGGLVAAHGAWVVGRHGARVSDRPCPGEGELPEVES